MQPMNIGEDSTDSLDNQAENDEVEPGQMGGGVMNLTMRLRSCLALMNHHQVVRMVMIQVMMTSLLLRLTILLRGADT